MLDGEIVLLAKNGVPRFQLLQQWQNRPSAPVVYYLFDLLWSDGFSEKGLADAIDRLRPFFTDKPPVENPPKIPENPMGSAKAGV